MSRWTPSSRAKQAVMIHLWRPWEHSTGPRTAEGKEMSSMNAFPAGSGPLIQKIRKLITQGDEKGLNAFLDEIENHYLPQVKR